MSTRRRVGATDVRPGSDGPRMRSYREAIGRLDLRGKTVLDVGCGTGLLALWCAQQGAARVVAVEASPMARAAREVVEANGLGAVVEVAECRVEELQLAPRSVHLVVSEWMGFHLVNESMLDAVRAAPRCVRPLFSRCGRCSLRATPFWRPAAACCRERPGCCARRCSATATRPFGATRRRRADWT